MGRRKKISPSFWLQSLGKPSIFLLIVLFIGACEINNGTVSANQKYIKGLRLRTPKLFETLIKELQADSPNGVGLNNSNELAEVGPFFGNAEMIPSVTRKKKSCGMSSIAARALINPSLKRSYFATTSEEMEMKQEEDNRQKREVKRSEFLGDGSLPWTCETQFHWKDMGADHYPRFVRTAECQSRLCFNGFFRCKPRRYKTKVLRRVSAAESVSCEDDDVSLPESLRNNWKFVTVTINLCCDCAGRLAVPEPPTSS